MSTIDFTFVQFTLSSGIFFVRIKTNRWTFQCTWIIVVNIFVILREILPLSRLQIILHLHWHILFFRGYRSFWWLIIVIFGRFQLVHGLYWVQIVVRIVFEDTIGSVLSNMKLVLISCVGKFNICLSFCQLFDHYEGVNLKGLKFARISCFLKLFDTLFLFEIW